jgi:acyl-CoA synthetase (AMP-forming)/AMP-acid ligase II
MLPNISQMVTAYYATLRNGAIAVAINLLYRNHELAV